MSCVLSKFKARAWKVHSQRYTNADIKILQYILPSYKKSITQIAHYNTFHNLRYAKCWFTNIKTIEYVKKLPIFKKNTKFTDK